MFGKKQKEKPDNLSSSLDCSSQVHQPAKGNDKAPLAIAGSGRDTELVNIQNVRDFSAVLMDDDSPLSEEDIKRFYKSPKNVMGRQKIRELINANRLMKKQGQQTGAGGHWSSVKMTLLFGLALSLQVVAVLLIFI